MTVFVKRRNMYDIIIIGAGPAGLTAAIYALRAGKKVLVIEKEVFGGQINYSPCVENYPGFSKISGAEFAENLLTQAMEQGLETDFGEVTQITDGKTKTVVTADNSYECKSVIIATGARHRHLGVDGEDKFAGRGVSYCAVCDGAFFKGKKVAVVGGGDAALQDAIFLSERCSTVYIIHRRNLFRAEERLVKTLEKRENVSFVLDTVAEELVGSAKLEAVKVRNVNTGKSDTIEIDGLFIAVGQEPQNQEFANLIKLDAYGYADSGEDCKTSTAGIFVAGDCRKKEVRQLTTAASDGAVAALCAVNYINGL